MARVERLSAVDTAFLDIEREGHGMHVGAVLVLDGADLVAPDGALDAPRVVRTLELALERVPRFRQRIERVMGIGAAWVDDPRFRLEHHVVHTAVPRPGDLAQLRTLAGRIFERRLDLSRPPWELWLVEGVSGGRFAAIMKAHHAMVDGIAGMELLASLLRVGPEEGSRAPSVPPAAAPLTHREVARALLRDRVEGTLEALRALRAAGKSAGAAVEGGRTAAGLVQLLGDALKPAARTSLSARELSVHRSYGALRVDLERVKALRRALGGTLNDVVLAICTGALRRLLERRGDDVASIRDFRALVPVNLRGRTGEQGVGNHVAVVLARLPIDEPDTRARYARICAATSQLKNESREIEGTALLEHLGDVAAPAAVSAVFQLAAQLRAFDIVITNVPGPQFPLYLGPARMTEMWGLVPLFAHQGLGIAALSYDGSLTFGLHADPCVIERIDEVERDLAAELEELEAAVRETPARSLGQSTP